MSDITVNVQDTVNSLTDSIETMGTDVAALVFWLKKDLNPTSENGRKNWICRWWHKYNTCKWHKQYTYAHAHAHTLAHTHTHFFILILDCCFAFIIVSGFVLIFLTFKVKGGEIKRKPNLFTFLKIKGI